MDRLLLSIHGRNCVVCLTGDGDDSCFFIFGLLVLEHHHKLGVCPLKAGAALSFLHLMLEDLCLLDSVHLAIYFTHESDRHIGHEVEDVDCCPGALAIKIGRVRPLMS
jgi:hypothetical protein